MREALKPKSIAREMVEMLQPFGGYIKEYGLARSEGLLLRYLSEVYKTLVQTIPELARTPELDDVTQYLGSLVRGVDSSLLDEWERMQHPERLLEDKPVEELEHDITRDRRAFTALIRNLCFSLLRALADRDYESFLDLGGARRSDARRGRRGARHTPAVRSGRDHPPRRRRSQPAAHDARAGRRLLARRSVDPRRRRDQRVRDHRSHRSRALAGAAPPGAPARSRRRGLTS